MLDTWEDAAQNLTEHFRAVCRGHIPLNMVWSKADQDAAEVDDQSLRFIAQLRELEQSQGKTIKCTHHSRTNIPHQLRARHGFPLSLRRRGAALVPTHDGCPALYWRELMLLLYLHARW